MYRKYRYIDSINRGGGVLIAIENHRNNIEVQKITERTYTRFQRPEHLYLK